MPSGDRSPTAALAAALAMAVVGASTFNILPLLTAGAAESLGFSAAQIGLLAVAITVGSGAGAIVAGFWVRSAPWPVAAAAALAGLLATNAVALFFHRYEIFLLVQGAAGFFGSSVFCLAMSILSDRPESARAFGAANAMQVTFQVLAILAGPTLLRLTGLNGILGMLTVISGMTLFLTPLLPRQGKVVASPRRPSVFWTPATLISLIGFFVFAMNVGAYGTYVEVIGQAHGMTPRVTANGLAVGISAGILGGLLAWALGNRWGSVRPIALGALLIVGAALFLNSPWGVSAFVASGLLYFFAWNYSNAYQLALIGSIDATGRAVAITQAFGYLGVAGGASTAALFVSPGDYHAIAWVVMMAVCLSAALFALSTTVYRYAVAPLPA